MSYQRSAVGFLALIAVLTSAQVSEPTQNPQVPWPTGEVEVVSGSVPCDGEGCEIQVTCANVAAPARAIVKVDMPTGPPARGTILLMTGGDGTDLYEQYGGQRIVDELRAAGFHTAQLQWVDGWLWASPGEEAGHARLGCRPATVARWVHDNIHQKLPELAYCAAGGSGGAMQIGYMLTYYGLEEVLDTVVPDGGPPTGRIDLSCLRDDPDNEVMLFGIENDGWNADWLMDGGFGYPLDGSGPCARGDTSFRDQFREASVASGDGDYSYPRTLVWFLFGENDEPNIKRGMTYHDLLIDSQSPLVRMDVLPGVGHSLHPHPLGADKILDILINECRPRHE